MITRKVIRELYRKYRRRPDSPDCLDMPLLFEYASAHHGITVDMDGPADMLIIRSIEPGSPFHSIPLDCIHAIVPFEEWVAVVLHSSIIFLSRSSPKVSINIRMKEPSFIDRLAGLFRK